MFAYSPSRCIKRNGMGLEVTWLCTGMQLAAVDLIDYINEYVLMFRDWRCLCCQCSIAIHIERLTCVIACRGTAVSQQFCSMMRCS